MWESVRVHACVESIHVMDREEKTERRGEIERERSLSISLSKQKIWPICIDSQGWKRAIICVCVC